MSDDLGTGAAAGVSRRRFLGLASASAALTLAGAPAWTGPPAGPNDVDAGVATDWFDLISVLVRSTSGFSPPVASRAFGYAGLALYEAVAPGSRDFRSLQGSFPGFGPLPASGKPLHWPTVASTTLADVSRSLFSNAGPEGRAAIDQLEERLAARARGDAPAPLLARSVERGRTVAAEILAWAAEDGGHEGQLRNFPSGYVPPVGPGLWVPTPPDYQPALQPTWGANRCFVASSQDGCVALAPTAYSEDPASQFHLEALEVHDAVANLTEEQERIARFWSDDPGQTSTPPGHSISITTQVLRSEAASLMVAAEAYAKVGMAVADAFIVCWRTKYRENLLRPVTYLRAHVDPDWLPPLATPPFPEYSSGHSVQSAAAFHVLADLFGDDYAFDDHTHDRRGMATPHFPSFSAAAEEAAISRLYGGIHFRPAIDHGLEQGRCIGAAVVALPFRHRSGTAPAGDGSCGHDCAPVGTT